MLVRSLYRSLALLAILCVLGVAGCSRDNSTTPAEFPTDGTVFLDEFGNGVIYQAFSNSKLDAIDKDITESHSGSASISVIVPDSGNPSESYSGGAFTVDVARNLTEYNALTFWAKADKDATLDIVGIGNDNTGTSEYIASVTGLSLTTTWTKYAIPIPLSNKLSAEQGLFYFAEGPENGDGYQFWFDDIQYETLQTITNRAADIGSSQLSMEVGDVETIGDFTYSCNVDGIQRTVTAFATYLTFASSAPDVAIVSPDAIVTAMSEGTAEITASLGSLNAQGSIDVTVTGAEPVPTTAAPAPTVPATDVISLFSDAYTDANVDTWSADWDVADVSDETVASDNVKKYSNLSFAGIEFANPTLDVSEMTRFHMDIWTPNQTALPKSFKVKLVDYGDDGVFGADDSEHELTFTASTSPGLSSQTWVSIDVPLTAFSNLTTRSHMAQLIVSGDLQTVYIDNIYFYDAGSLNAPTTSAPSPTEDQGNVISLFSDSYNNVNVDTWSAVWDDALVQDFMVGSDTMKKYTELLFAGIEFRTTTVDATDMTHFHIDIWTPDPTSSASFKIKLVDFGSNGTSGGGDDSEHEITLTSSTLRTGLWVSADIALSDFTNLTDRSNLAQLIVSGSLDTVYLDNIYFYDAGVATTPEEPAPAPTFDESDVVSLYSDAYTDVPVDTWSAPWDTATVTDLMIGSNNVKKYTDLLFAGIEFTTTTVDASQMTHFHMDIWTPDATASPAVFKIKLVDFGPNGVWDGGGDDVEHEMIFDENTMTSNSWVSIDVPLSTFTGLTTRGHLAQLIISGDPNTVYIDNVLFHK